MSDVESSIVLRNGCISVELSSMSSIYSFVDKETVESFNFSAPTPGSLLVVDELKV